MPTKHYPLKLATPQFESHLTELIMDLNHLRKRILGGTTPAHIFFQIKNIFHIIESICSARIEGNRTTILEYIDSKIDPPVKKDEKISEIRNMEKALDFIDKNIGNIKINKIFINELHKRIVKDLTTEGSKTPGQYRKIDTKIAGSKHTPPSYMQVDSYMNELFEFINKDDLPQYDLLKTAISNHRFVWIHPFDNGNGRTVRLFTYAMLAKQGFRVSLGRIINPTAVFCINRDDYYKRLSETDSGEDRNILKWCEYVLGGLKKEVEKIDKLSDFDHLKEKILIPALRFSLDRKLITDIENKILAVALNKPSGFKNQDLQKAFPSRIPADISRLIRQIKSKKMIIPIPKQNRKYTISFANNYILRGVISALGKEGFLPVNDDINSK